MQVHRQNGVGEGGGNQGGESWHWGDDQMSISTREPIVVYALVPGSIPFWRCFLSVSAHLPVGSPLRAVAADPFSEGRVVAQKVSTRDYAQKRGSQLRKSMALSTPQLGNSVCHSRNDLAHRPISQIFQNRHPF